MQNVVQLVTNTPAALSQSTTNALEALTGRFVRVPNTTASYPKFRDLLTGLDQADADILCNFYYGAAKGTVDKLDKQTLLSKLHWCYGEDFKPNGSAILEGGLANMWQPPKLKPTGTNDKEEVALFLEFLERWFPDRQQRKYFLWWIAHSVRRPEQRITATLLLRSEHGVGKGFFAETLMANLLGRSSVVLCSLKDVVGDFNDVIEGKTFILIDEVYRSKKTTVDALKAIQGNATFTLRRKHKPVVSIENYINFAITSNDHIPLMLESEDRRFWVPDYITHKEDKHETEQFINNALKPWLVSGGFQKVRNFLETINLDWYTPTAPAPMTESKQALMGYSTADQIDGILESYLESLQVVTLSWLKHALEPKLDRELTDMQVSGSLLKQGCVMKRAKTQRYYITPKGIAAGLSSTSKPKDLDALLPQR
ncbi:primase-helicase family protein [Pseudomonas sp. S9]|uniref:primase-helicase family protein n=1 Tax=Pseudomonas sp. S9 TaxID=686578 RepID=UPI000255685C|nr:primase-helicase family protein [Pseudomonas sp. S9]